MYPATNFEAQSQILSRQTFIIIKKSFDTATWGLFRSSCCFYFKSNLQLLGQWSVGLNLAKIKNTDNYFGTEGVAGLKVFIGMLLI
jgi:hypothetical protein